MLSAIRSIRRDPADFLLRTWQRYGDVVQFPIPRPATYLFSHPDAVREILVDHSRSTSKRTVQYDALSIVTGLGLLTADDPPWRERRTTVQPAFHAEAIATTVAHTRAAADRLIEQWSTGPGVVDVQDSMMQLSLEVVASSLFGTSWQKQAPGLTQATMTALDEVVARARNPLSPPISWPTMGARRMRRAVADLNLAVTQLLDARAGSRSVPPDVIDLLLDAQRSGRMTRQAVRDEIVTMLIAGHETVGSALTWAWQLLADRMDIQDALAQQPAPEPGGHSVARQVIDETLRLYPPAWLITRRTTQSLVISDVNVPADSILILSPWVVHRHPAVWTDPDRFDPGRFTEPAGVRQPGYLPFGLGSRLCIGREFALMEAVVVIDQLARRFRFSPASDQPVVPLSSVTVRPEVPLRLRLESRN